MKRIHLNLNLTSVVALIAAGVLLPVMLSTAVGIVALFIANDAGGIVTGVLVISFAVTAMGSALVTVVLTSRKARLARLQGDFVANMTHEFRTPLSAIRLYTQTLQSGKLANDPKQTSECLATILRETTWLDAMIDRVLTWRAASKDMLPLEMNVGSVMPAVELAIKQFQSMVIPDQMTLTTALDSQLLVRHDHLALHMIILNLLTNAYKYTGRDKIIHISVQDEQDAVLIQVRDNGIGLQPHELKHIFQPFYRVAGPAEHASSGSGLGLAIAHHLVQEHKGSLTVTSEKNQGAVFTVRLPAVVEAT